MVYIARVCGKTFDSYAVLKGTHGGHIFLDEVASGFNQLHVNQFIILNLFLNNARNFK